MKFSTILIALLAIPLMAIADEPQKTRKLSEMGTDFIDRMSSPELILPANKTYVQIGVTGTSGSELRCYLVVKDHVLKDQMQKISPRADMKVKNISALNAETIKIEIENDPTISRIECNRGVYAYVPGFNLSQLDQALGDVTIKSYRVKTVKDQSGANVQFAEAPNSDSAT